MSMHLPRKRRKRGVKTKRCPSLSNNTTGRDDTVPLPSLLVPEPKPKPASLLVDATNTTPAVQLKGQVFWCRVSPKNVKSLRRDEQIKKFEELINNKQYKEIAELGKKMSDEELSKCLYQVVTSLDRFKGLYRYLKQRKMVPGFLAHGKMVVVRKVIVETKLLETDWFGRCDSIYDAIALSLDADYYERVADLFEAAHERPAWKHMFNVFMNGFFARHPPEKDSMPLKRFFALHREEFSRKHPAIFEIFAKH